jgi:ribosomal protein L33
LENLTKKRIEKLNENERKYLEYLANWSILANKRHMNEKDFSDFTRNLSNEEEALKFFIKKGFLVQEDYISQPLGSNKIYHHPSYFIPSWVMPVLQETFEKLSKLQKEEVERLEKIKEEEAMRRICPICNKEVLHEEEKRAFGYTFHLSCFKNAIGEASPTTEKSLGKIFEKLKILPGKYLREVPVGKSSLPHPYLGKRKIDLVIQGDNKDWIIEIKMRLDKAAGYSAIGQVVVYEMLWRKEHPNKKTKKGIICLSASEELLNAARIVGISVFSYQG